LEKKPVEKIAFPLKIRRVNKSPETMKQIRRCSPEKGGLAAMGSAGGLPWVGWEKKLGKGVRGVF